MSFNTEISTVHVKDKLPNSETFIFIILKANLLKLFMEITDILLITGTLSLQKVPLEKFIRTTQRRNIH